MQVTAQEYCKNVTWEVLLPHRIPRPPSSYFLGSRHWHRGGYLQELRSHSISLILSGLRWWITACSQYYLPKWLIMYLIRITTSPTVGNKCTLCSPSSSALLQHERLFSSLFPLDVYSTLIFFGGGCIISLCLGPCWCPIRALRWRGMKMNR